MKAIRASINILGLATALALGLVQPSFASNITVDTTIDALDAAGGVCAAVTLASLPGADGVTTLREAMCAANNHTGPDTIQFNITGCTVCTIEPIIALPVLTGDETTIDGFSQPGAAPATEHTPAALRIQIDGSTVTGNNGLNITSAGNIIRGLIIKQFPYNGIAIGMDTATGNLISGNYIGSDHKGQTDFGNGFNGVFITLSAQDNIVGGVTPATRNVILGNDWSGVAIFGSGTMSNTVSGNYIGTDATVTASLGHLSLGNTWDGVTIYGGAQGNNIGGDIAGERNIISGNGRDGVRVSGGGTSGNSISGNYIGTNANGTAAIENQGNGILIQASAQNNMVGGETFANRNIISGNGDNGVAIKDSNTTGNIVSGNFIGINPDGGSIIANNGTGVRISDGAQYNAIGGESEGERNVISGNSYGVIIHDNGTTNNVVSGNFIGTDATGTIDLGNIQNGVKIGWGAQENIIGGDEEGERNVISGNYSGVVIDGYHVSGSGTMNNTVSGNYVGTDLTGSLDLGNDRSGISIIQGAHDNTIGGSTYRDRNVVSGNDSRGIVISGPGTTGNTVLGNIIGADASGRFALGNFGPGVTICCEAQGNKVGPDNMIAHNVGDGVLVSGNMTKGNAATGNSIYANAVGINLTNSANNDIAPPIVNATTEGSVIVTGTACASCVVELFENSNTDGEGEIYLGSATADISRAFLISVDHLTVPYLTATATDVVSGTSEFSGVFTSTVPPLSFAYLPMIIGDG